ncbi:MAG: alpha/beta hydrolase fold domain-containing protein [Pseudomonadota bacterium]
MAQDPPASGLEWSTHDVKALRQAYADMQSAFLPDAAVDVSVDELAILGFNGLIFTPAALRSTTPILYFHGGRWVAGSPWTHLPLCSWVAGLTGQRVISARYALAPEHPFPAQKIDAVTALNALAQGRIALVGRPRHIVLAGDDAGAAVALWAEAGVRPATRALIERIVSLYGIFGLRDSFSLGKFGPLTPGLSSKDVLAMYARLGDRLPPTMTRSFLAKGAPLTVLIAGGDPLADDSHALVKWARGGGRAVRIVEAEELPRDALHAAGRSEEIMKWLRAALE